MRFPAVLALLAAPAILTAGIVRDVPYVEAGSPLRKLDIHLPDGAPAGPRPVLVAVHGGGWKGGDKADPSFIEPLAAWFLPRGFIVVSVNYRLTPAVRHPQNVDDVRAALRWVSRHIGRHGGDPGGLHLCGHSAGAHLAAMVAVDQPALAAAGIDVTRLRAVILYEGVGYDLPSQMRLGTPFPKTGGIFAEAFGTDRECLRQASPVHRVDGVPPPFLIVHARLERSSRLQARLLAQALRRAGGRPEVRSIWGKNHGNILSTLTLPGDPTARETARFLGVLE